MWDYYFPLKINMDTKPLELEALNYIESMVARYGFHYCFINYDENGGDFFIIQEIDSNLCTHLRCQSKGRSIFPNTSSIELKKHYVSDDFLVFVYLKPEDLDCVATYLFTGKDIKAKWKDHSDSYSLYLGRDFINNKENNAYIFNKERASIIESLLSRTARRNNPNYIKAISDSGFYCKMWSRTAGLPPIEYLSNLFSGEAVFALIGTDKFVFLICALIIQNRKSDTSLSPDWSFNYLKEMEILNYDKNQYRIGHYYHSDVSITYYNTWVEELLTGNGELFGYHLHMGDDEESVDNCVFRSSFGEKVGVKTESDAYEV